MHIATLPGKYGVGQMGSEARRFVDYLAEAGQKYWQVLPLVPTGYGDSPYQSVCSFAGSEYFISLESLAARGLLAPDELASAETPADSRISYRRLFETRFALLRLAFHRDRNEHAFRKFVKKGEYAEYALFRSLKTAHTNIPWRWWPEIYRYRDKKALAAFADANADDILFWQWAQFEFDRQWHELREYAHKKGVSIIGDLPIYIAYDSVECWAHPELVKLNADLDPVVVAGCPPDAFSPTGQLWGNPVYDWKRLKADGYRWWKDRFRKCFSLFDVVRIDHFRGFDRYYEIPYGDLTAENGYWEDGPSSGLFAELEKTFGKMRVIAEDLGELDDSAREMFRTVGYPGMKVLQFAFGSGESNEYLPHNYTDDNCVAYTGTHDNDTLMGAISSMGEGRNGFRDAVARELEADDMSLPLDTDEDIADAVMQLCLSSKARLAVVPMQDWLKIGKEGRINMPSTLSENNWSYRIPADYAERVSAAHIREITQKYGRTL